MAECAASTVEQESKSCVRLLSKPDPVSLQGLYQALCACMEDCRGVEIGHCPRCLRKEGIPEDPTPQEAADWVQEVVLHARAACVSQNKIKRLTFGARSEKLIARTCAASENEGKYVGKTDCITRSEYNRRMQKLVEQQDLCLAKLNALGKFKMDCFRSRPRDICYLLHRSQGGVMTTYILVVGIVAIGIGLWAMT